MKKLLMVAMVGIMIYSSGCASYMSYSASKNEIVKERAFASGDAVAIKAVTMGDGVGLAINVSEMDALLKHPWRQLGAALLDVGLVYGTSEGVKSLNNSDGEKDGVVINTVGNGNNTTVNTGDNNSNMGNPNYSEDNSSSQ